MFIGSYQSMQIEEIEIEEEKKLNELLRAVDEKLYSDWNVEPDASFEDEDVVGYSYQRPYFEQKKKKPLNLEIESCCKIWKKEFPHIGVFGISLIKEDSDAKFISYEQAILEEQSSEGRKVDIFGGLEEEIIVEDRDYCEVLAIDTAETTKILEKDVITQLEKKYIKKGFPPLDPVKALTDSVSSILFQRIWKEFVVKLKKLRDISSSPVPLPMTHHSSRLQRGKAIPKMVKNASIKSTEHLTAKKRQIKVRNIVL